MTNDFEIGGRKFKAGKINAFKQFHLVRRIAPILADLLPSIKEFQKLFNTKTEKSQDEKFEELALLASPLLKGFSKLSDEDSDKVLFGLLSCVEMLGPGNVWARVATENMLMIQDLELPALLQIAGRAFIFNLSGFFAVLPSVSPAGR